MAQLIMHRGPEPGRVYFIKQDEITIGRGAKNDIVIIDNEVSREHCRFTRSVNGFDLSDLGSSNGTFVNGQRVKTRWSLPPECIVELGDSITFSYREDDEERVDPQYEVDTNMLRDLSNTIYYLVVSVDNRHQPSVYPLEDSAISIGRGTDNKIIILEPEISRNHLRLIRDPKGYRLEDLGSTNGTNLNGTVIRGNHLLHNGDIIRIGTSIVLRYTHTPHLFVSTKQTGTLTDTKRHRDSTQNRRTLPFSTTIFTEKPHDATHISSDFELDTLAEHALLIYAREDWETLVAPIADYLYQAGIPIWVEQYLTPGEEDWHIALDQARTECWLLIVVVSKVAMETEYIRQIWRYFHNREKPIILVVPEEVLLPLGAKEALHIPYDIDQPEESLEAIVETVRHAQTRG
jgi:pSer/pThr/pTyr-binding forkhead associated (FHA) protein